MNRRRNSEQGCPRQAEPWATAVHRRAQRSVTSNPRFNARPASKRPYRIVANANQRRRTGPPSRHGGAARGTSRSTPTRAAAAQNWGPPGRLPRPSIIGTLASICAKAHPSIGKLSSTVPDHRGRSSLRPAESTTHSSASANLGRAHHPRRNGALDGAARNRKRTGASRARQPCRSASRPESRLIRPVRHSHSRPCAESR